MVLGEATSRPSFWGLSSKFERNEGLKIEDAHSFGSAGKIAPGGDHA